MTTKILMRLRRCAGWSESSLSAYVRDSFSQVAVHKIRVIEKVYFGHMRTVKAQIRALAVRIQKSPWSDHLFSLADQDL